MDASSPVRADSELIRLTRLDHLAGAKALASGVAFRSLGCKITRVRWAQWGSVVFLQLQFKLAR